MNIHYKKCPVRTVIIRDVRRARVYIKKIGVTRLIKIQNTGFEKMLIPSVITTTLDLFHEGNTTIFN